MKPAIILAMFVLLFAGLLACLIQLVMQNLGTPADDNDPTPLENLGENQSITYPEQADRVPAAIDGETREAPLATGGATPIQESEFNQPAPEIFTLKKPGGKIAFTLRIKEKNLKITDPEGIELVRVSLTGSSMFEFKESKNGISGYLSGEFPEFTFKNAGEKETLFEFRRKDDGDWKLKRPDGVEICRIGKRDYGWKIESGSEKFLGRVKVDDGRTSLRDSVGEVLYYTNDMIPSLSLVPFGMPELTRGQAAALSTAIIMAQR